MSDRIPDWGPLDDFEDEQPDDAPSLAKLRDQQRRCQRPHEYVSPACAHRDHENCDHGCSYCENGCLCVCHAWSEGLA